MRPVSSESGKTPGTRRQTGELGQTFTTGTPAAVARCTSEVLARAMMPS
jgi:hypothetical protein